VTAPARAFRRFVALDDSQIEGVGDDRHADGSEQGWADRFAGLLAAAQPGLLYANLAVRGPDVPAVMPAARLLRSRVAGLDAGLRDMAARHGSLVLDGGAVAGFADRRLWCENRLHFSPAGHRRLAAAMAGMLGVPAGNTLGDPGPLAAPPGRSRRLLDEVHWAAVYAGPWMGRLLAPLGAGALA
jgi:lysophospholipase L1-like esterase